MIVRLLPDTASVCARSVALKASSSSGVIREVSPTTSPGSSARASAGSPSVASRSPARNRPANRWTPEGPSVTSGTACPRTRSTPAIRSPPTAAGADRAMTRSRVEGNNSSQGDRGGPSAGTFVRALPAPMSTMTNTGARVATAVPSAFSTRRTSPSISTEAGAA